VILGNALVVMYSRCGNVQTAFDLFDRLPEKDIVSWNTMITAFVQNEFDLEGLLLVYQMQKSGFAADSVTLTAVLSAASNTGGLQIGKQAHGYLIRHGIESKGLESHLIDMYAKSSRIEIAQRVFDGYETDERDDVTRNAMIAGYTQSGQSETAVLVFREMLEAGLEPTSVTLASVLPACDPLGGGICAGKQIHCFAVRHHLDTNVFVGTALVDMYSKCGEISTAECVFAGMTDKSTVSYTTMISGLGQHGFGKRAMSLFYSMRENTPEYLVYRNLFIHASKGGHRNNFCIYSNDDENYQIDFFQFCGGYLSLKLEEGISLDSTNKFLGSLDQ
jgi:pentatricopeptide repeat protein